MGDFLDLLVARSTGAVPAVRPNLPSRFEPAAETLAELTVVDAETPSPGAAIHAFAPIDPAAATPRAADTVGTAFRDVRRAEPAGRVVEAPSAVERRGWAETAPLEPGRPGRAPEITPSPRDGHLQAPQAPAIVSPGSAWAPTVAVEAGSIEPRPLAPPTLVIAEARSAPAAARVEPTFTARPSTGRPADSLDSVSPPTVPVPAIRRTVEPVHDVERAVAPAWPLLGGRSARRERTGIAAEPIPVPDVHVTIGRVDVRASNGPAVVSAPRPSGPRAMTLDEYLRRRRSGG